MNDQEPIVIDGYNFLFFLTRSDSLFEARLEMLEHLAELIESLSLEVVIVFDGREEGLSLPSHFGNLKLFFSGGGKSADDLILELFEERSLSQKSTLITKDRTLQKRAEGLGVQVLSPKFFYHWLLKRSRKKEKKLPFSPSLPKQKETFWEDPEMARWERLFEERLKKKDEDSSSGNFK